MKVILLAILFCIYGSVYSQKTDLNQSFVLDSSFYSEIPYKDVNGSIIVTIHLEGVPYKFMLDTGAPLIISKELSDKLQLIILEKISVADQSQRTDTMEVVLVDQFRFGDVIFKQCPAIVAEQNPVLECYEIDGLIGSNVLKNAIVQLNKKEKKVIITSHKENLILPKISSELYLDSIQSNPFFSIRIKRGMARANEQLLFDSGMDALYDLSENHYHLFKEKADVFTHEEKGFGNNTFGLHGVANNDSYLRGIVPKLKIGKLTIKDVRFSLTKSSNSRIGSELLDFGIVTIDYLNKKFYIDPFLNKTEHIKPRFPINPTYKDGKFVVGIIWDKNLENEMAIGDEIISVNGYLYRGQSLCQLMMRNSAFKNANLNELIIKYLHKEKEKVITIKNKLSY